MLPIVRVPIAHTVEMEFVRPGLKASGVASIFVGMVRPVLPLLLACAVALVCPLPAAADQPPRMRGHAQKASPAGPLLTRGKAHAAASASRDKLWATVNICDTEQSPDAMGIRASMPGNGRPQLMFMRFSVQWWSGSAQRWLPVPGGVSPWLRAGSARYVARQRGYTFDFVTPAAGRAYVLRGVVEFHWRGLHRGKKGGRKASWKLTRHDTQLTRTGVEGVDGGDPPGTSKAMCMVANLGG